MMAVLACIAVSCGEEKKMRYIAASSGLSLRFAPRAGSRRVAVIPFRDEVNVEKESGRKRTIQGKTGRWSRVVWKGKKGWVFGGFLSETMPGDEKEEMVPGVWLWKRSDRTVTYTFNRDGSASHDFVYGGKGTWHYNGGHVFLEFTTTYHEPEGKSTSQHKESFRIITITRRRMHVEFYPKDGSPYRVLFIRK